MDQDIPYLLLTPGPLTTSRGVREAMLQDYCTWDADYNDIVQDIRRRLVELATHGTGWRAARVSDRSTTNAAARQYTCVLMQGSGTFTVEAAIGSLLPPDGKLLVVVGGAYGARIGQIADRLKIPCVEIHFGETEPAHPEPVAHALQADPTISHVAVVHCETTTGMLNPVAEIGGIVRRQGKTFIVDAMSSFGGIPFTIDELGAHCLISSANKCIQGVPGFGFVIVERDLLAGSGGWARSLSLDLYDQWRTMEENRGKWRYTSPTHCVRAFAQALDELDAEGGVWPRYRRFCENQARLVEGMEKLGFRTLLPREYQSPIITSFFYPETRRFTFAKFYQALKKRRFVIYPGKISQAETFRIGTIGHLFRHDIDALLETIAVVLKEL